MEGVKTTRKSYSVAQKLAAVKKLNELNGNLSAASRELGIDRKNLRKWKQALPELGKATNKQAARRAGCGRKAFWPEIETELIKWVRDQRNDKLIVNYRRVRERAVAIANELHVIGFRCSDKWIFGFCRRHGITSRRLTHVGQEDNRGVAEKRQIVVEHLENVKLQTESLLAKNISNMDETPCFFDMVSESTLHFVGDKNVDGAHTGHEKNRFTVVLAVSADGKVMKTLIIFKGLKKTPKVTPPPGIHVEASMGGTMNESLMLRWIDKCFNARGPFMACSKGLLVMDQFGAHKKESIITALEKVKTSVLFLPPRMTHMLQPLDVGINSVFKCALKVAWEDWFSNGKKEYTPKGYRKRPSYQDLVNFVGAAIQKISPETIVRSFESCGIQELGKDVPTERLNSRLRAVLEPDAMEDEEEETCSENESAADSNSDQESDTGIPSESEDTDEDQ